MTTHHIGYARVSTQEQDLQSQLLQLSEAGCEHTFHGKHSGAKGENQKQLDKLVEYVRKGDTVLVTKLDRLGRSLKMILATLEQLEAKGVAVRSLDGAVDTTNQSPTATAQRSLIAVFAQLERDLIVSRTSEGRDAAISRGVKFGRKQKLTLEQQLEIRARHQHGESIRKLAGEYHVGRPTIDRVLKR
jgi:DNA invertase Pin-like site-specific DNA recombinase